MIRKLLLYEEVAELFTVLLRRGNFRLTQGRMDLLNELLGAQTLIIDISDSGRHANLSTLPEPALPE